MEKVKKQVSTDMTKGSPAKLICLFALPLLAGNVLQQFYNMVDSIVVGNFVGDAALAAVGTGFPVIFMLVSLFMGMSTGATVMISQYYGAGDRERMKKTEKALSQPKEQKPRRALKPSDIHLGDTVRVLSLNLQGTVSSLPDARGSLFVQMGILRSQVKLSDLELVEEAVITSKQFQKSSTGKIKMSKSASVSTEINLIGMTVDEALAHLDKYLDDAYLAHLPSVRIVHGKGTGALRKAVQGLLKRNKYVKSYRLGEFGEGDAGVTIATFKQE